MAYKIIHLTNLFPDRLPHYFHLTLSLSSFLAPVSLFTATMATSCFALTATAARNQSRSKPLEFKTKYGRVRVCDSIPQDLLHVWHHSFAQFDHDHRYYELTHASLSGQFDQYYLLLDNDQGQTQAIQPFFIVTHDLLEGLSPVIKRAADRVRQYLPNFMAMRMLMVGSPAGEGELAHPVSETAIDWVSEALHEALPAAAKLFRAPLIVLKDFPKHYRPVLSNFSSNGYSRLPSMPATELKLDYDNFDHYVATTLSKKTRQNLRKKFKDAAKFPPITMEVVTDLAPYIDVVYPLYQQVLKRATLKFEELNRDYFLELGRSMPDRTRFFLWRMEGRIVAFSVCIVNDGTLYDKYIGIDYSIALDAHLYFITLRDTIEWAIQNKIKTYYSAPLNYDPKRHLRQKLVPLDLYACHTTGWINAIFRRMVGLLGPTRHDPILAEFENFKDLE